MKENRSRIVVNEPMGDSARRLRFEVDWDYYDPGQFVMLEVPGGEVFLRRPFGIADLSDGSAEVCYKIVGKGTRALTRAEVGTGIDVTGPCGKGFLPPSDDETAILVAGGYGIGPLMGLARSAKRSIVYYGAKTASDFLYLDHLSKLSVEVKLATEDGSRGDKGFVTELLNRELSSIAKPALYACGPHGLLAAVAKLGMENGIPTQVSTEEYMACGIGVCMGCVCERSDGGRARTCSDGPVFEASELKW